MALANVETSDTFREFIDKTNRGIYSLNSVYEVTTDTVDATRVNANNVFINNFEAATVCKATALAIALGS